MGVPHIYILILLSRKISSLRVIVHTLECMVTSLVNFHIFDEISTCIRNIIINKILQVFLCKKKSVFSKTKSQRSNEID